MIKSGAKIKKIPCLHPTGWGTLAGFSGQPTTTVDDWHKGLKNCYTQINSEPEAIEPNSPKGKELDYLATLVEDFEREWSFKMGLR